MELLKAFSTSVLNYFHSWRCTNSVGNSSFLSSLAVICAYLLLILSRSPSEPGSVFSLTLHYVFEDSDKTSPLPSVFQTEQTWLPQPLLVHHVLQPSSQLDLHQFVNLSLMLESPNMDHTTDAASQVSKREK